MRRGIYLMKMIHEILEEASKAKSKGARIKILQDNNCRALRDVLRGGMDSTIQFILPETDPPYTPGKEGTLEGKTQNVAYFIANGPGVQMIPARRERLFIEILENVHPKEAELFLLMKNKGLIRKTNSAYYTGITRKLVQEAFPGLLKD